MDNNGNFIIYKANSGKSKISVQIKDNNIWLNMAQIADIFNRGRSTINGHIQNIFNDNEIDKKVVCRYFRHTTQHGAIEGEIQNKEVIYYNLKMIISIGYRVKSIEGIEFRKWATDILDTYITKGFAIDSEKLQKVGGGDYWIELLEEIRNIRSSEKVVYRQVLELYATSIDYDPKAEETITFFKVVQNKLYYAVNKKTSAEIIHSRVNAEKNFMGLSNFVGKIPLKEETLSAKNYLKKEELFKLNRLVSAFFDLAELKASQKTKMRMKDWVEYIDKYTKEYGEGVLNGAGKISREAAIKKVDREWEKYKINTLSPVEKDYLNSIKNLETTTKKIKKIKSTSNHNDLK